jgi:hypothetical protein
MMKKFIISVIFLTLAAGLGYGIYRLNLETQVAKKRFMELVAEKEDLVVDSERLKEDLEFFQEPHNLEKELRARFNVKLPQEKLIIVVPQNQKAEE